MGRASRTRQADRRARVEAMASARLFAAEAARQGITSRVRAVHAALGSPAFERAFQAALDVSSGTSDTPVSEEDIRALALTVLEQLGMDTRDVLVTIFWEPPHLRFTVRGMTPAARARVTAAVAGGEVQGAA